MLVPVVKQFGAVGAIAATGRNHRGANVMVGFVAGARQKLKPVGGAPARNHLEGRFCSHEGQCPRRMSFHQLVAACPVPYSHPHSLKQGKKQKCRLANVAARSSQLFHVSGDVPGNRWIAQIPNDHHWLLPRDRGFAWCCFCSQTELGLLRAFATARFNVRHRRCHRSNR